MPNIEVAFYIAENCIALGKRAEIAAVGAQYLLRPARIALGIVDVADVYGIGLHVLIYGNFQFCEVGLICQAMRPTAAADGNNEPVARKFGTTAGKM